MSESDLVKRLRAYTRDDHERLCKGREYDCSCGYDGRRDPLLLEAADRIAQLEAALRDVMVGGNHLAQVLGIGHLAAGSSYEAALEFYGPGPNYDVWCCWNAIMQARAALLAGLRAWPGMYPVSYGGDEPPFLVLPLTENTDGK